jgi:hypothetical protein
VKRTLLALLLSLAWTASAQLPKFMGRNITVIEPKTDPQGYVPMGPATVCIEGPPQRQCYTAPSDFGRSPDVQIIQLEKNTPALFFTAAGGGVSGFPIHFALLQPSAGKTLNNLFEPKLAVSEQSQHAFWNELAISGSPIFLTANYVWGPTEAHHDVHRCVVSVYLLKLSKLGGGLKYYLEDQFMTVRQYDLDDNADVLAAEKPEILSRLRRVKAAEPAPIP